MFGLHPLDVCVVVLYLLAMAGIGLWTQKCVRTMADFFMPRTFGKLMLASASFATGTHPDQAVGVASKTFSNGLSGIWYEWLWLFCTPFYWLIAPLMRRFRAITMSDVFTLRYDQSIGMLFAVVGALNLTFVIGIMLKGSGAIVSACLGQAVSPDMVIFLMAGVFVLYGMAGGLTAVIITDFVQGILTVVFSFVLLPSVMKAVGGMAGLHQAIKDPGMFSLVAPAEIGVFYIAVIALNGLIGIVTQPHIMGNCAAGRTEMDGRVGFTAGNFAKRICTMAWCLTGLAAMAYLGKGTKPDLAFGVMAREFLPKILPGLLGVFLASVLASLMSSCDSFMVSSSALFTANLYRPLVRGKSEGHYVTVGRLASLVVVGGGVFAAYRLQSVVQGLETFWKISPMMGIAFWLGFFWRRMTVAGAWASVLAGFGTWLLTTQAFFIKALAALPFADALRLTITKGGALEIYLPWQMVLYLVAGTATGIVVSLLSRSVSEDKLERFYALGRTPVRAGEAAPGVPCALPDHVEAAPRRNLFRSASLEIPTPTKTSVVGFIVCWVAVAVLIYGFVALTR
jgi:Na+/proline symporter